MAFKSFYVNIPTINTTSSVLYTVPSGKAFIVSNLAGISWTTLQLVINGNIIGDYWPSNYKWLILSDWDTLAGRTWSNAWNFYVSWEEVDNI